MRFVITMNMPSSQGYNIHQIIFEHKCKTVADFCELLNDEMFIVGHQIYKRYGADGEATFINRGDIIVNTSHIGKVQEYYDTGDDERSPPDRQRPPLRNRNQY